MSTDFKMSFVNAGKIKWIVYLRLKKGTNLLEESREASGCVTAVIKAASICLVKNKNKHLLNLHLHINFYLCFA